MAVTWSGISAARARLARLSAGLKLAASGAVLERAAEKVAAQVRAIAKQKLEAHALSGAAAGLTVVDVSGGLIKLHGMPPRNAKNAKGRSYVSLFGWWPFRRGMPQNVVKRASVILARELLLALGGRPGAGAEEALDVSNEADAADTKAAIVKLGKDRARADRKAERDSLKAARNVDRGAKVREGRE